MEKQRFISKYFPNVKKDKIATNSGYKKITFSSEIANIVWVYLKDFHHNFYPA